MYNKNNKGPMTAVLCGTLDAAYVHHLTLLPLSPCFDATFTIDINPKTFPVDTSIHVLFSAY